MSKFAAGNLFLFASMLCTASSHVMIKKLVDEQTSECITLQGLLDLFFGPKFLRCATAGTLLIAGFTLWILCLSRLSLSYAYPVASTSIVLISFFSIFVLGETVSPRMWIGTGLILVGVLLLRPPA